MAAWETEDETAAAAAASLPTPSDTPYRTPSRVSRRSSRQKSKSPEPSSSPVDKRRRGSPDIANSESISILDPRRFTPTLHANLVSEILTLRRDQEEKTRAIERLETDLYNARGENEQLQEALGTTGKESRSLKRQLALLEGGTSSALSELARERDEAVDSNAELKRKLETAQKKARNQEEDSDRVHDLWAKDKDKFEEEKRKFERRIHVAELRLKTVLDEVAAYQASQEKAAQQAEIEAEDAGLGSDTASIRSVTNSIRFSTINGDNKLNGLSLADELDLDDEDNHTDKDGRESVLSNVHKRSMSRESVVSKHHRRNQSIESLMRPGSVAHGRLLASQALMDRLEDGILEGDETNPLKKPIYVDTGIQYSAPSSPELRSADIHPPNEPLSENGTNGLSKIDRNFEFETPKEWEVEANQRRKRVHASSPLLIEPVDKSMVSAASQTQDDPLSPPRTPISPTKPSSLSKADGTTVPEMVSSSTQTDAENVPEIQIQAPKRAPPPVPIPIPSIQLHPPKSTPSTPRTPLLPQHSKDFGCQVSMQVPIPSRSISVQTEEIRVDRRLNLLPPHLQPSSISSSPPSPEPPLEMDESKRFSPVPGNLPPRNPRRTLSGRDLAQGIPSSPPTMSKITRDAYPASLDDGSPEKERNPLRRPSRVSSLFTAFANASSDEGDEFADADMSDNDFRTALSAPRPQSAAQRASKRLSTAPTLVADAKESADVIKRIPGRSSLKQIVAEDSNGEDVFPEFQPLPQRNGAQTSVRQLDKPLTLVTSMKPSAMRRSALIQSGVAAHHGRSRSPSLPDLVKEPPFPIPNRQSSKRFGPSYSANNSDGTRSPPPGRGYRRGSYRAGSIRKVRSAAALPRGGRNQRRQGSRSPPPMSASTEAPESPGLPPMPNNEITTPRYMKESGDSRFRTHRQQQPSTHTAKTTNTAYSSIESPNQASSVVDAIAQTMVGEWMYKYVRRRKSFGVSEANGMEPDNGNGSRHKRWVWLAPYERAVMWSSKQPTSGTALMGKSGRKLAIQSVLDVKDDNPPPKGLAPLFNRSILILTPARALKFTAINAERHYIWLSALSFLAHSSQAVPEIVPAPLPIPQPTVPDFEIPKQNTRLRKNAIRDSIRIAKGKTTVARSGPTSVHSSQQGNQSLREAESFYTAYTDPNERASSEAADAPVVPRERGFNPIAQGHGRKRSNTGSRVAPPLSFRGFSGPAGTGEGHHVPTSSTAGMSIGTNGSSDYYQSQPGSIGGPNGMSMSGRSSIRTSDASGRPGVVANNFFDAVGTMRMEAFISPMALTQFSDYPDEQDEVDMYRMRRSRDKRRRSRNGDSYYSGRSRPSDDWYGGSKTAGEEEYAEYDPFKNF